MDLPIILIVTSNECNICKNFRKDGKLYHKKNLSPIFLNKYFWNKQFFKKLLNGNTNESDGKFKIIELFLNKNTYSDSSDILEYSEFYLINDDVIRYSAKLNNENNLIFTKDINYNYNILFNANELITFTNKINNFEKLVNSKIPKGILPNFIIYFPCFMFFDYFTWNLSLSGILKIHGLISGISFKQNSDEEYIPDISTSSRKIEDPILIASTFL